jgi:hypothetical protein
MVFMVRLRETETTAEYYPNGESPSRGSSPDLGDR